VQEDCQEDNPSQPVGNEEAGSDGDSVEESMNHQTQQHRKPLVRVNKLIFVRFLSEVEMRGNRVLKKMDDEIADQNQESRIFPAQLQTGGKNLDDGRGQHESRAQGHKILKVPSLPVLLDDDGPAEYVGSGRGQAKQEAEQDWIHGEEG